MQRLFVRTISGLQSIPGHADKTNDDNPFDRNTSNPNGLRADVPWLIPG